MRVVVTGATGNVGTAVVEALAADAGVDSIVGVARRTPDDWHPAKTEFVAADLTTDDLVAHVRGADAVVHLAWAFQPTHQPAETWRVNVVGSDRTFRAVAEARVPVLVHASSVGAYSPGPDDDHPVDESWPTHSTPTAGYGREKAYVERMLDAFETEHRDVRVVRMRPGFIFRRATASEQRRIFAGPFVPARFIGNKRLPVLPYPKGLRFQALHSADAAEAYRLAITGDARGPFNIAADPVLDGPALADLFDARPMAVPRRAVRAAIAAGWHSRIVPAEPSLYDLFMRLPLLDTSRAARELGWRPVHSGRQAIEEMLEGLRTGAGMGTAPLHPGILGSWSRT
ncbi:MAG: NAD-dependent epimerase/dehydratase family protein [Acidimicrobiia bacterium]|nr:NAD-dependent epimerase/dehydratase family protein [Acidimicrobiia bacterium]